MNLVDISTMEFDNLEEMTGQQFASYYENERKKRGWNRAELGRKANVKYGWLNDQIRNNTQRLDIKNAKKVIAAFKKADVAPKKINLSETENALFEAIQGVIGAICTRGNKIEQLEEFFSDQAKEFDRKQPIAADVMGDLLHYVRSLAQTATIPTPPQSRRHAQDQLAQEKNLKN